MEIQLPDSIYHLPAKLFASCISCLHCAIRYGIYLCYCREPVVTKHRCSDANLTKYHMRCGQTSRWLLVLPMQRAHFGRQVAEKNMQKTLNKSQHMLLA